MERKQVDIINFLKGVSITGIVIYHLVVFFLNVSSVYRLAATFGGTGVHVFIICSGFGLTLSYTYKPLKWIEFIKKRLSKVYMPYIVMVLISFFVPFVYMGDDRVGALLSHIFLYKMFIPKYVSSFGLQLWFVSTIIQFYLVFLLLIKTKIRLGNKNFFLVSCIASVVWIFITIITGLYEERIWNSFFLQYLWEFCLGMCLADSVKAGKLPILEEIGTLKAFVITIASLAIFAIMSMQAGVWKSVNDVFGVIAFGGIGIILYRIKILRPIFASANKISYEWYLVHVIVFTVFFHIFPELWVYPLAGIIILAISVVIACLYKYVWEKVFKPQRRYAFKNRE